MQQDAVIARVSRAAPHHTSTQHHPSSHSQVMYGDMKNAKPYVHKNPGTCATFGCSRSYQPDNICQCTADCEKYHNCCDDFKDTCKGETHNTGKTSGSCATFGCVSYQPSHACQCNDQCTKYKNCCDDAKDVCFSHASSKESKVLGSCFIFGCDRYQPSHECQCNDKCTKYHNCCDDYEAFCNTVVVVHG